jgi:hypothetical protein
VFAETALVATWNEPLVEPTAIETLPGTTADDDEEPSFTLIEPLPEPGTALRLTDPRPFVPPGTFAGETLIAVSWNGFNVSVAVWTDAPLVAVIVTVCVLDTAL